MTNPRLWLSLIGGAVFLVSIGFVVVYLQINRYIESEEFRQFLSRRISQQLNVEGELSPLRRTGFSIYADDFLGKGQPQSPVRELKAHQIFAELAWRDLFIGLWHVQRLQIGLLHLTLQETKAGAVAPPSDLEPLPPVTASWWQVFFPRQTKIGRIEIGQVNLDCPTEWAGVRARGMKVNLIPQGLLWEIEGSGGKLESSFLTPAWMIHEYRLRLRSDRLYVTSAELRHPQQGNLTLAGEIGLGEARDARFDGIWKQLPLVELLTGDWRARLAGELSGEFRWEQLNAEQPWQVRGKMQVEGGKIEALPMLNQIALLTQTQDFRSLRLQQATADFTGNAQTFTLENIMLESQGLARVEGTLSRTGSNLNGQLQLGMAPHTLRLIPAATTNVFKETRGAYAWTPVQISGTMDAPIEDLSPRLMGAAAEAVQDKVQDAVKGAIDFFNQLRK
jgi:hypothetical protein